MHGSIHPYSRPYIHTSQLNTLHEPTPVIPPTKRISDLDDLGLPLSAHLPTDAISTMTNIMPRWAEYSWQHISAFQSVLLYCLRRRLTPPTTQPPIQSPMYYSIHPHAAHRLDCRHIHWLIHRRCCRGSRRLVYRRCGRRTGGFVRRRIRRHNR